MERTRFFKLGYISHFLACGKGTTGNFKMRNRHKNALICNPCKKMQFVPLYPPLFKIGGVLYPLPLSTVAPPIGKERAASGRVKKLGPKPFSGYACTGSIQPCFSMQQSAQGTRDWNPRSPVFARYCRYYIALLSTS